jgi:hypothetical protein
VVLASRDEKSRARAIVVPVIHSEPAAVADAIEIPAAVKARLRLDSERSWIVVNEANRFGWPGPDLRFVPGRGPESATYGFLPAAFFAVVRDRFVAAYRGKRAGVVTRTE